MGKAKLSADEMALIENLEEMMGALKDRDLTEEEQTLFDGLSSMIAELRRMDAGKGEEPEPGTAEDELSPEEKLITKNLLDDIGALPGGRELIRMAAGDGRAVRKDLEHRGGVEYGAARYDNPRRNTGEPGAAEIGAQLHDMKAALAQQAEIVRRLLEGMGIADSVVGRFGARAFDEQDRPEGFNDPQQARLWALHKTDRVADELAGQADEELRRRPSRHELGQVQKSQALRQVVDEVAAVVARLSGASSRAGASGAEVTRDVAKELLTATFTAEAASPERRW